MRRGPHTLPHSPRGYKSFRPCFTWNIRTPDVAARRLTFHVKRQDAHEDGDGRLGERSANHAQFGEACGIPSVTDRWFADHDSPAGPDQPDGSYQCLVGGSESTGHGCVEGRAVVDGELLHVPCCDGHPIDPSQPAHHSLEEVRPLRPAIEQRDPQIDAVVRDHQTRHTAAGAEVDDRPAGPDLTQPPNEAACVVDDLVDGSTTQESQSLGLTQRVAKIIQ